MAFACASSTTELCYPTTKVRVRTAPSWPGAVGPPSTFHSCNPHWNAGQLPSVGPAKHFPRSQTLDDISAVLLKTAEAGLDEGLPSLTLSNLLCVENPYSYKKFQ